LTGSRPSRSPISELTSEAQALPQEAQALPEEAQAPLDEGVLTEVVELREAAARQAASMRHVAHRPWPLPSGPWIIGQTWTDLVFIHWRVPPSRMRPLLPVGLELDTFEGGGWLTVTPLRMSAVGVRGTRRSLLGLASFLELNVRTYVTLGGKPGVYFFSLHAESRFAVRAARALYRLPYFPARMSATLAADGAIDYLIVGLEGADATSEKKELRIRYCAAGPSFVARPGSLEHFLTERYCLYTEDPGGRLFRAEIHHEPWSLRPAEVAIERSAMAPPGIDLARPPDLAQCGGRQDVVTWPLRRVR